MALARRSPQEAYDNLRPANRCPRFEPRPRWPRPSRCARPQALVKGAPGVRLEIQLNFLAGRKHLPVLSVRRAA